MNLVYQVASKQLLQPLTALKISCCWYTLADTKTTFDIFRDRLTVSKLKSWNFKCFGIFFANPQMRSVCLWNSNSDLYFLKGVCKNKKNRFITSQNSLVSTRWKFESRYPFFPDKEKFYNTQQTTNSP